MVGFDIRTAVWVFPGSSGFRLSLLLEFD